MTGELLSGSIAPGASCDRAPFLIALTGVRRNLLACQDGWCQCVTVIMRQRLCWPTVRGGAAPAITKRHASCRLACHTYAYIDFPSYD